MPPVKSPVIYQVQGGFLVSNNEKNKYIFDNRTQDVKAIHVKVIRVNKADAGLYGTESQTTGNMDGCCLLIVTGMISALSYSIYVKLLSSKCVFRFQF